MSRTQLLKWNLLAIAYDSLRSANRNNPFISKSVAMHGINEARMGKSCPNAIVLDR